MKNYIQLKTLKFYEEFAYFDLKDGLADEVFIKHSLNVKHINQLGRFGYDFHIFICRILRKDIEVFKTCMQELHNEMIICGHSNYDDFCNEMCTMIEKGCA